MLFFWLNQGALDLHWGVLILVALLVSALYLDALLGEPRRFHPLVGFGRWATAVEALFNRAGGVSGYILGFLALIIVLIPIAAVVIGMQAVTSLSLVSGCIFQLLILYLCIGWQSLQEHVEEVWRALATNELVQAREALARIVSRNTRVLDEDEVAQASIESTLENSSDALFATLFWFVIAGAEGALLHRWVNTLDAMWGYRNERFFYFGWAAAKLDDAMAWIPSRIAALCFVAAAGEHRQSAMGCWKAQAKHCASPNGGVVMTAGAGALNRRLSARAFYDGAWQQKPAMGCGAMASIKDIPRAITLVRKALLIFMACTVVIALAVHYATGVL